jgi:hypothetical protein
MPFDASYQAPQAPAGLLTMQDADAKALNLRNAVQAGQLGQQQLAEGAQRMQENTLNLQEKQRQMDQTRAVNDAYRNALTIGSDGAASIDSGKLTKALSAGGHGSQIPSILEGVTKYQKANADLAKVNGEVKVQEADAAGAMGATLEAAGDDPHLFLTMAQHEINAKTVDGAAIQPLMQRVAQSLVDDPTGAAAKALVGQIRTRLVAASGEQQKLRAETKTANAKQTDSDVIRERQDNEAPSQKAKAVQDRVVLIAPQLEAAYKTGGMPAVAAMLDEEPHGVAKRFANVATAGGFNAAALTPIEATTADETAKRDKQAALPKTAAELSIVATDPTKTPAERQAATDALKRLDQYSQGTKTVVNLNQGGVTADDYARAGEQYMRTGVMPPLGMSSGGRMQVLHAGNEWARAQGLTPGDVVTMQAAYSGDKKSLEKFQGQRDQIVSFENTAKKNIDQFLDLASKVPDTGSPWINTPLRLLNDKMVGSANIAALNAARAVATNEIAKVTSGGSMSGVLSDSARQEVKDYNPQNATYAQTVAVVKVLKKDMANRHESMDQSLGDIKSRFGGSAGPAGGAAAPNATKRFNPATGQIEAIKP